MGRIGVFLLNVEDDVKEAIRIIEKFQEINNLNYNIRIFYDYTLNDEYGFYEFDGKSSKVSNIYINPIKCYTEPVEMRMRTGFIDDYTILSTILHEFGHLLDFKYDISEKYDSQNFKPIELGEYAKSNIIEEFAELMVLYLTNPYFLKMIDKERYNFLRSIFKSPSPCSKKRFLTLYNSWHDNTRIECSVKFGICARNGEIKYK
jgi:hypothetical protein